MEEKNLDSGFLESIVNSIKSAVVVHRPDTTIAFSNAEARNLLGMTERQMQHKDAGDPKWEFVFEDFSPVAEKDYPVNLVADSHEPLRDYSLGMNMHPSKDTIWVLVHADPLFADDGRLVYIVVTFVDITKRKQAEEGLVRQESKFQSTFENMQEGVCLHEVVYKGDKAEDYRVLEANSAYEDILGIDRQEALGQLASRLYGTGKPPYLDIYSTVAETGQPSSFETHFPQMERYFRVKVSSPEKGRFITIFEDITDIKLKQEEINHAYLRSSWINDISKYALSGRSVQEIIDYTVVQLKRYFPDYRIVYGTIDGNGHLSIIRSVQPESMPDLTGMETDLNVAPEYLFALRGEDPVLVSDVSTDPRMFPLEAEMKAGETKAILDVPVVHFEELCGFLSFDSAKAHKWQGHEVAALKEISRYLKLVLQNEDIWARLKKSEKKFRTIFKNAPVGIFQTTSDGKILDINPKMAKMTGCSTPEETLANYKDLGSDLYLSPERRREFLEIINREGAINSFEYQAVRKDGSIAWFSMNAAIREKMPDGSYLIDGFTVDVTERKRFEDALESSKNEAQTANRAKSEFLANMSHEIRTPFNGILGMLQLLQGTELNEEQKEYVDMAASSSNRLQRLLSDILDLSRMEANKMEIREEEFKLGEVVQSVREIFRQAAEKNKNGLKVYVDGNIPENVFGDHTRLTQILFNLVGNACKYTQKGEIDLQAYLLTNHPRILFAVTDTGKGIPDDKLHQALETFTQVNDNNSTYTRKFEGAGLGLPLIKRLVHLMGGNASIVSRENEGTTVYVSLPFNFPPSSKDSPEMQKSKGKQPENKAFRILLVDDEKATQLYIRNLLEKSGYVVTVTENGQNALGELGNNGYACILMDIQMPVLDGVEATKRIRNEIPGGKDIPIIALTAYAMTGDREKFLQAGMDDYVAKPVNKNTLLEVLYKNLPGGWG